MIYPTLYLNTFDRGHDQNLDETHNEVKNKTLHFFFYYSDFLYLPTDLEILKLMIEGKGYTLERE